MIQTRLFLVPEKTFDERFFRFVFSVVKEAWDTKEIVECWPEKWSPDTNLNVGCNPRSEYLFFLAKLNDQLCVSMGYGMMEIYSLISSAEFLISELDKFHSLANQKKDDD